MTEIAVRQPAGTLGEKMQYAQALAQASLLPVAYRKQPGNVLLAIEVGESLGLTPITAINNIHVIDGKPSASAALVSALVRRAGHRLRVLGDDAHAVAEIVRVDDPDFTYRSEWTTERAKTAGLLAKGGAWTTYRAAMLKARAVTEVARDACQEVLSGLVQYTPEELGAIVDEEGAPVVIEHEPAAEPPRAPTPPRSVDDLTREADAADAAQLREIWREAVANRQMTIMVADPASGEMMKLGEYLEKRSAQIGSDAPSPDPGDGSRPIVDAPLPQPGAGDDAAQTAVQGDADPWARPAETS